VVTLEYCGVTFSGRAAKCANRGFISPDYKAPFASPTRSDVGVGIRSRVREKFQSLMQVLLRTVNDTCVSIMYATWQTHVHHLLRDAKQTVLIIFPA
jgi:hypothetical protein